jgi:nucleotide-binding universal stress UspA family protein
MLSIRTILVPVDFSDPSKRAVGHGLSLALELDATLVLAHVVGVSAGALNYTFPLEGQTVPEDLIEETRGKLLDLIDMEYRGGVKHREIAVAGDVQETLLRLADSESADLVVMGTHGRRPFERWFLGSLTERMLRKIPVPIMTVSHLDRTHAIDRPHPVKLERILYATDLSPVAERAVGIAAAFAHEFSAELHIVHVRRTLPGYAGTNIMVPPDDERKVAENLEKQVVESVPEAIRRLPNVKIVVVEGHPYEALLGYIEENAMDMIILNTQSRSGLDRALVGSVAERIVRGAHVPVLSVPPVDPARPLPLLGGGRFMI